MKINAPRASVVIPTRNRATLLRLCLQKLIEQEIPHDEIEVLVVDDGSTDETSALVHALAQGSRVRLRLIRAQGRGPAVARNLGWRAASAPVILFTDDDCEPSPTWAAELIQYLEIQTEYAGVGGQISRLHESWAARYIDNCGSMRHPGYAHDAIYLVTANAAYRRSQLEAVGGFSESFQFAGGEDPDLSSRVRASGARLGHVSNAIVHHNHPNSISGIYRMHFRYGRAEYLLPNRNDRGEFRSLLREWRRSFATYRRRRNLNLASRTIFFLMDMITKWAFFKGFRHQAATAAQSPRLTLTPVPCTKA